MFKFLTSDVLGVPDPIFKTDHSGQTLTLYRFFISLVPQHLKIQNIINYRIT